MRVPSLLERFRAFFLDDLRRDLARVEASVRTCRLERLARDPRHEDPRSLARSGYRCFSQFDEDGTIDEIFRRIGTTSRSFVEFGAGDGLENNTLALLVGGWTGLWIEASGERAARIRTEFAMPLGDGRLRLLESFVTAENIEELLERGRVPAEPDLLSVDIDGNDYWVWRAIGRFRPRAVVIEYNASLGRTARAVQPYRADAVWDETTAFGASLGALEDLGREKGYVLVGCSLAGVNAFFVRQDLAGDLFLAPHTAERHFEPPRFGATGAGHRPAWGRFVRP